MRITITRLPRLFGADAMALTADWILLHPSRKDDTALIAHESIHTVQIEDAGGPLAFWLRYLNPFSRKYRLACEVEAYRHQLLHRPDLLDAFAKRLANSYWLRITADEARQLLTSK